MQFRKCVTPVLCVKIGKGMYSNTTMSIKVYLMSILDNYMFRPLLPSSCCLPENLTYGPTIYIERARGAEVSTYGPYCVM